MIIVSVERNRVLHQHSGQTWAEIVPFSQAPHTGRLVYLWKEWVTHDEDGVAVGTLRERAGQITVLRVRKPVDVLELDLEIARSCGHRTSQALRDAWWVRHPRTPLVAVVYFALGDWRDRDVFMNFSGRSGGDYCVDDQTEALTKRGWLRYDGIRDDDELLGYDIETHTTRWEGHSGVHVFPDTARTMVTLTGRSGSIVSTPNHRWPVVVDRKQCGPLACPSCGDLMDRRGYPMHSKSCERNQLIARRFAVVRSRRLVAEEFGVSEQVVKRAAHRLREGTPQRRGRTWKRLGASTRVTMREERTTETLGDARLLNGAPCTTLPPEPTYGDAFVELVAWVCTEGSRRGLRLSIAQSIRANEPYVRAIENALERFAPGHWRSTSPRSRPEMRIFLLDREASAPILAVAPNKVMSHDFITLLTREQLELLWRIWLQGDGTLSAGAVGQKAKERLDPLQVALALLGDGSTLRFNTKSNGTSEWLLTRLRRHYPWIPKENRQVAVREGIVWCPTTPSTYWLARRDGRTFLTGNTRNARRALDPDAPVLTREEIEQLSFDGRQRDDARRAKASAALTTETSSQRLLRIENYIEQLRVTAGDEAARAAYSTVRQELRIVRQRLTKAERRRLGASPE